MLGRPTESPWLDVILVMGTPIDIYLIRHRRHNDRTHRIVHSRQVRHRKVAPRTLLFRREAASGLGLEAIITRLVSRRDPAPFSLRMPLSIGWDSNKKTENRMTIFSFRAECQEDVDAFIEAATSAEIEMLIHAYPDTAFPDVDVEITTEVTKEVLMKLISASDEGHVMRQTLRAVPLKENSLSRDLRVK